MAKYGIEVTVRNVITGEVRRYRYQRTFTSKNKAIKKIHEMYAEITSFPPDDCERIIDGVILER